MGTDIHSVFQKRGPDANWLDVPSQFAENRHYQLFAVLAGVRNGHGFAGTPTGDEVTPIAAPRGLPDDFLMIAEPAEDTEPGSRGRHPVSKEVWDSMRRAQFYKPGDDGYGAVWMGYHDHSWLLGSEILRWAETAPIARRVGIVSREVFATWVKGTEPADYCGGVSGPNIRIVRQQQARADDPTWTHASVAWHSKLRTELAYFLEEVARLQAEHGEVRFVFGFDS